MINISKSILILIISSILIGCKSKEIVKEYVFKQDELLIYTNTIKDSITLSLLSDTHLSLIDDRDNSYKKHTHRMSLAYIQLKDYKTNQKITPTQSFLRSINRSKKLKVDVVGLLGDIFSYPSLAGIEFADSVLQESELNYLYISGNHDWHYEGMDGHIENLRKEWIQKRLISLYRGQNPLFYSIQIKGLNIVVLDNSTYEISTTQLKFFKKEVKRGLPIILLVHIPFYIEKKSLGYGCAHPDWNRENDKYYKLEGREAWPVSGSNESTIIFREELFKTSNLLAVFSGHIHRYSYDFINRIPQITLKDNASGFMYIVKILPRKTNSNGK